MQEDQLGDLGIFRIPIPIPFPQAGGPANVYAVEEERGLMLFDTGLGTEDAQAVLAQGIERMGHRFQDINRIVLSHGHIDHFGSAAWVQDRIGRAIPILIHEADSDKVLESGPDWPAMLQQNTRFLGTLGIPPAVLEETAAVMSRNPRFGRRLGGVQPLKPDAGFHCRHVTLQVLHMPGHTPGLCCLYEPEHRLLFSADHLLERVSPNPLMDLRPDGEPSPFRPLITYFKSVNRIRELDVDLVLPGHGEPFTGHRSVIDSLHRFYARRQGKILKALEDGPLTVYEAMKQIFAHDSGFELILKISETLGNLEMLEANGEIKRDADAGIIRFRL